MKRILSMFLALCMVMTLLPVSAMAEEIHTPMDTSGEIISFVPLAETEKKVSPSTSTEDLELPEKLTAMVRIAEPIKEGSVQDSENPETTTPTTVAEQEWVETTVDILVTWESTPEFDMNTEGEYVFTPVIKGYTVSAPLPQITVTVGEPAFAALGIQPLAMNAGDVAAIGEKGYATLQAALDAVADGDTIQLLENIDLTDTVTIASGSTKSFILDLNGKTLNGGNAIAIQHNGGTLTVDDTEGEGKVTSMVADGTIHLNGGSLVIISGTVENTNTSKSCAAVSNNNSGSVLVNGGTVTAPGSYGFGIANHSTSSVSVSDGTVSSGFHAIINNSNGKVSISGGEVKLTGSSAGQAIANMWDGEVSVSSGVVDGGKGTGIYNDSTGKIVIPSGSPIIKGETCAMDIAPDLSDYTNVEITASTEYSGLPTTAYDEGAIATYKYLTLAEGGTVTNVAQIGSTSYLTLQAAIDAAVDGQTVTLLANITADSGISAVVLATDKEITLNLNGYTISGSSESVSTILINTSGATLTIEDSAGGGTVSASGGQVDSGNPAGTAVECAYGNLIINGGRIYSRYGNAVFVQSGGTATINGGTINSDGSSFTTIYITGGSYFNICGGTIDSKYTALNSIINIINVNVSSGSAIVKGNSRALFSSTINIDTGTQATASTEYDGSSPVAYDPEKKYDYKYLKFEPAPTVSEQFNLAPGGTYYFDLSSEKSNIGTVNTALPDISLHYVPFTYAGTVNAYSLASQMTTTEVYANANKSDRSLFVGDYVIGRSISWNSLNTNGLIFGKDFDTNYKLRSLSAGSSKVGYKDDSSDHIGQPNFNEWDQILKKSNSDGYATEWIKNWNGLYSWGQDSSSNASRSVRRGYNSVHYWGSNDISYTTDMGFRPALEVLNPVTLGSEGLKVVTLNLNGGKLKENTAPIQIICTGYEFTAPSGEGLTAPVGKTFDGWKDTSGTTYHAGATVSDSVTGLMAQWSAPPVVTSVAVPTNATYSAGNNLEFIVNFSENVNVTGTPALSLTVGSQPRLADYASGSGTSALIFRYTVKGDDSDSDGISVGSLNLNGGTIKDTAGKNATLTLNSVGITSGVLVNATGAAITTVATADFVSSDQIIVFPAVASHNPGNQTIEYAISLSNLTAPTTGWQTGLSFASIMHSTTYYIWARTAAKPGYNAGTAVASVAITTAPPVNASISPISATFDLNPNGANYKDIDITLTQGSYNCMSIKNGGVPLLIMSHYSVNGNIYTLKKSYLSSLGEGATIITFQMSGGTSPALADNPNIKIGMDLATVKEINKQASTDVNITATRPDNGKLTDDAKKAIGNRPVFDLNVNYGSGKQVENFGEGNVLVTIPYTLGENEKAENVCAVYVNVNGSVEWLTDSIFDSGEKALRFRTNHFSTYGVGYKQPSTAFMDIEDHWAKENIAFVVERGLFSGTSDHTFSPNMTITRGMFVTVLGRLANADVSKHKLSSFTDVKSNAYYMGYIEWARENSIVKGSGNGKFAPDQSISREQMAVIMNNYAKTMNIKLPQVQEENIFADSTKISAYANDAVKQGQILGILSGKNGNLFDPQGTATRAEVSAVLSRFVKLMDSSDTM